jgi:hypothetical protein
MEFWEGKLKKFIKFLVTQKKLGKNSSIMKMLNYALMKL